MVNKKMLLEQLQEMLNEDHRSEEEKALIKEVIQEIKKLRAWNLVQGIKNISELLTEIFTGGI